MAYIEGDRVEYRGMQGIVEKIGPGTAVKVRFGTLYGRAQTRVVPIEQLAPGVEPVPEAEVVARRDPVTQRRLRRAGPEGYAGSAPAL